MLSVFLVYVALQLWEVYKNRRCIRTYAGHRLAVRDCCFANNGEQFISASYDRYIKVWDTETGIRLAYSPSRCPSCSLSFFFSFCDTVSVEASASSA